VLKSFPRHLSQHVGGFVITRDSLESLVPIRSRRWKSRTIIEWDKDDIEALGILKVDVLALGMLTCLPPRLRPDAAEHYDIDLKLRDLSARRSPSPRSHCGRLRHDPSRRHHRRLPDRKPGADVDAAAAQAGRNSTTSSSRSRSSAPARSRAAWCIPIYKRR
jgi:hypothetical protein